MNSSYVNRVAPLALVTLCLVGCAADDAVEESGESQGELRTPGRARGNDAQRAAQAAIDLSVFAPTELPSLPGMSAEAQETLLTVKLDSIARPGTKDTLNLRQLLAVSRDTPYVARALITGAFKTGPLKAVAKIPFAIANVPTDPAYTPGSKAVQVYECRAEVSEFKWTFVRPEAGLVPITAGNVALDHLGGLTFDHFRFPGDPSRQLPAGPAWRVAIPALNQGVVTAGQSIFVGALDASASNGAKHIPALRVRNVGVSQIANPASVFTATDPGAGTYGYVLRLNTEGGLAEVDGCKGQADVGKVQRVPYSAQYYFIQVRVERPVAPPPPPSDGFDQLG